MNPTRGRIFGQRGRISQLCDRAYDIELTFAPDPVPGVTDSESAAPSLFTSIREQLGLKLEAGKGPVEVMVVDSAVKLEEN